MTRLAPAALAACLVLAAARAADPVKADRAALIGTWKIVSFGDDGGERLGRLGVAATPKKGEPPRTAKLVVTETECWVVDGKGERVKANGLMNCGFKSFTLDPGKSPKAIDLVGYAGKDDKEKPYPGIYKLEDGKLHLCWNEMGKARPTEFKTTGEMNTFVCERLSDKPEPPPEKK